MAKLQEKAGRAQSALKAGSVVARHATRTPKLHCALIYRNRFHQPHDSSIK
jgi:hypothetical protein